MSDTFFILLVFLVGFLFAGALAPFEALGWWAGWFGREREALKQSDLLTTPSHTQADHFIVFLSGIHSVSEETFARREINLLEQLRKAMPKALVLEVFPYSVTNRALTGQRFFAWFWRLALKFKLSRFGFAGFVINLRNVFQVAVSADRRYGPIYNQGTAETIYRVLKSHGYQAGSSKPVTLIGYSGGGQIAIGAATYLKEIIGIPVTVISLGGIMCSDPGLLELKHLYHLFGRFDRVQLLGFLLFPGRWALLPYSAWNQATAKGLISQISLGPVDHTGKGGYLDSDKSLPSGNTPLEQTVNTIVGLVQQG
jgi:hypothetical protein